MKNLIVTLLTLFSLSVNAQIHVNNVGTSNADFESLQDAINQASEGDSIYVHATSESYGEISITKKVVLIAKSIFTHKQNDKPKIDKIILENISDDNSDASHSTIQGFEINYLMTISDPGSLVQNVTFKSNQLNYKPRTHSIKSWKLSNNKLN